MKTLENVREEMNSCGLSDYYDVLAPLARNSLEIGLSIQAESDIPLGASKFGGHPDLPAGVSWFRNEKGDIPLSFVAQINFAEAASCDSEHKLPGQGMLYFFYDCSPDGMPWGFDPEDGHGWKVYFYDGDSAALSRRETPADLEEDDNGILFGSARMSFEAVMELPSTESDLTNGLVFPEEAGLQDRYWDWLDESGAEVSNKLLGHADPIQGGMELECEYVTHKIYCGNPDGYKTAKAMGLDKNAARWNLLLQVDSNEELGMMWGDLGRLYLWITDEDLAARKFENSWLILQCG